MGPYFIKSWVPIGSLFLSLEVPISFGNSAGLASMSNLPLETEVEKPRAQHLPVNNPLPMLIKRIFFPALFLCQVCSQCIGGGSQCH